ncbi:unnamed protein product [Rotaria sordida]|uniref:Uncharacterized protein n=1 Tax=Rotaria sordida TaxID=392033 RepID=A0A814Y0T8_9BILA|nr:unnamed protein product [Rotaria sordida]
MMLREGKVAIFIENAVDISSGIQSLIPIFTLTIYYLCGFIVTYEQHRIGLLIFASIGVIIFIVYMKMFGLSHGY